MNISFNPNVSKTAAPAATPDAAPAKSPSAPSALDLTVTQAPASPEDIAAAPHAWAAAQQAAIAAFARTV